MTASPISDLNPVFMAAGCRLTLADKGSTCILYANEKASILKQFGVVLTFDLCPTDGSREVQMDDGFFTGYRRTVLRPQEVLLSVHIPYSKKVHSTAMATALCHLSTTLCHLETTHCHLETAL